MRRMIEVIAPSRMGTDFRWLMSSSWCTNLGDGIALAAGPLLIASLTRSPSWVAFGALLQRAPWLFFALYAGWLADRVDRKVLINIANVVRTLLLLVLTLFVGSDSVSLGLVLGVLFLAGTAEVFADTAGDALLPMLVQAEHLGIGNARLIFGRRALNELVGPPIGAALFALGMVWPFALQVVVMALGAGLISRIASSRPTTVSAQAGLRSDVVAGIKWLWRNPPIRTLTITVVLFNLTFGAMWPMLVLYAGDVLGMDELGFGLLLSASAIGGVLGAAAYGWLERRFSLGAMMRVGLLIETFVHLGLALSASPAVSMAVLFMFGAQASVWGTTATVVRQRAVPEDLQGRVGSVYRLGVFGGIVAGGGLGALISAQWGVLGPMWFGFFGSAVMLALIWMQLPRIAHVGSDEGSSSLRT